MIGTPKWLLTPIVAAAVVLALASPAAAVTTEQKLAVLSSFTQTNVASYDAWNSARQNQPAWAAYTLNWSTDFCSNSPDNPFGFDFKLSCWRHDFGYRNYKEMARFSANKSRLDSAFYEDLKRRCARYHWSVRSACYSLAWTYYQAVRNFGSIVVTAADLKRAKDLLPAEYQAEMVP